MYSGYRGDLSASTMKRQEFVQIHIRKPVTIREHELVIVDVAFYSLQTSGSAAQEARVYQGDAEILTVGPVDFMAVGLEIDGHIRIVKIIIQEILLDNVPLVA